MFFFIKMCKQRLFYPMLLDFPDTIFGNCAPHKLPFSQKINNKIFLLNNKNNHESF